MTHLPLQLLVEYAVRNLCCWVYIYMYYSGKVYIKCIYHLLDTSHQQSSNTVELYDIFIMHLVTFWLQPAGKEEWKSVTKYEEGN